MRPIKVVALVLGCFSALIGIALLFASAFLSWGYFVQRDGGESTLPPEEFRTSSSALVSDNFDIFDSADSLDVLGVDNLGYVTLGATSRDPGTDVFVGIGPTEQVLGYLDDVAHARIDEVSFNPFRVTYDEVPGDRAASPPADEQFWSSSAAGPGAQELSWNLRDGSWTAVVMNADASPAVAVDLQLGAHLEFLGALTLAVLGAAVVFLLIGVPLIIIGAVAIGRHHAPPASTTAIDPEWSGASGPRPVASAPYPTTLTGVIDQPLSRGLWLVKWLLLIPHYIVLVFLGVAFFVTTVASGFAILFSGRYPRGLFEFNVGVLRWAWRVQFYGYSALGTDRYPPFTLRRTDYPADFTVEYPKELSRGLVLVKWWLLAIPHYFVLALLAGGWYAGFYDADGDVTRPYLFSSLLGLLVLIVGLSLLFRNRYPNGLGDFIMGINRWAFRVAAYAALMRDEYPPFRLDQGPQEPNFDPVLPAPTEPDAGGHTDVTVDAVAGTSRSE
ncbi:DUF4389 domain-containing protein [Rhodococcus sp. CUA-806]|nr:DUF4389 domain-containing protein [Rhodococcus sp. CUA-806]